MQTKVQVARWPWGAHKSAVVEGGLGLLVEWCECFFFVVCGVAGEHTNNTKYSKTTTQNTKTQQKPTKTHQTTTAIFRAQ